MNPQDETKLMLAQAIELQDQWKPAKGDCFIVGDKSYFIGDTAIMYKAKPDSKLLEPICDGNPMPVQDLPVEVIKVLELSYLKLKNHFMKKIWFPSIEQLQSMINLKELQVTLFYEEEKFYCRITSATYKVIDDFLEAYTQSMLWLKIVMYVKYRKYWNEDLKVWTTELPQELL